LLLPKLATSGHIYHKIWGYFSQGKCTYKRKKRKSSLEARKMKLECDIFVENASFYSRNSNPIGNRSLKNRAFKKKIRKSALKFFLQCEFLLRHFFIDNYVIRPRSTFLMKFLSLNYFCQYIRNRLRIIKVT
jgi:hypothetical protein